MEKAPAKCVHCGGTLLKEDGERKCLSCGRTWKNKTERHRFYDEHRYEILKDVADIGRQATREKWQIPSATMHQILTSWLDEKERSPGPGADRSTNGHKPAFPEFSNEWDPQVQIKWLEVWALRR